MKRAALALFTAIPAILLAGSMALADRPRVVIVARAADDPAVVRVRGELTMLGADVEVVVQRAPTADLSALAKRLGAAAALRVEGAPPAIVLWVEPGAGATPGEVRVTSGADERDPALLALRAVEVLRARLLHVPVSEDAVHDGGPAPDAPSAPSAPAPPDGAAEPWQPADVDVLSAVEGSDAGDPAVPIVPPSKGERARPVGLSAGAAMVWSPGGVPAAAHVRFGAAWEAIPRLAVEATAFVPVTGGAVSAAEGSMELKVFGFGAGVSGKLTDPRSDFSVALGLGVSALMLSFDGRAQAPWVDGSGGRWAAAPYAAAGAAYRLHPRFSLRLDLAASVVLPEPVLRIAGHDVATFGQPAIVPSLSAEVRP